MEEVLAGRRDAVLVEGLSGFPSSSLKLLLRHPRRLLELQELVLSEGGAYWSRLNAADSALASLTLRGEQRLSALFAPADSTAEPSPILSFRPPSAWYRRPWIAALASAAAVLLVVYLAREPLARRVIGQPTAEKVEVVVTKPLPSWGWQKLETPLPNLSPSAYLEELAKAAEQWFNKRPDDSAALAQRIGEMRQGCSRLIFAEHTPLKAAEDRRWLVQKCRDWATKFDKSLEALEAGRPAAQVRQEMDGVVRKLVATLRERAELLKEA